MSIKRVAESVDLDVWIPATVEATTDLTAAILRIFRDQGGRKDRQKGRLMWLIEEYGEVKEVNGHPRVSEKFRKRVIKEMSTKVEKAQPKATAPFERRSLLGVHSQPQAGKSRVGVHVRTMILIRKMTLARGMLGGDAGGAAQHLSLIHI